jgi:hypothetical protein
MILCKAKSRERTSGSAPVIPRNPIRNKIRGGMTAMLQKKYAKYIVTEDARPEGPPPGGFLKRLQDQREAGDSWTLSICSG